MTYNPGATRVFHYPLDKFSDLPRPSAAQAWADIREMATQGHPIAAVLVKIDAAQSAKKIADAEGSDVPAWARETLSFMDEYQPETENLDEALALLNAAL